MRKEEIQALLREGIAAARAARTGGPTEGQKTQRRIYRIAASPAGQRAKARRLLTQVVEQDETNILAWLWLSTVIEEIDQKRVCLENVLALDPDNKHARAGLERLDRQARAVPLKKPVEQPALDEKASPALSTRAEAEAAQPQANQTPCPFCNRPISMMATTCDHCHLSLVVDCPACGARTDVEQANCSHCHHSMGDYRQGAAYFAGLAQAYRARERHREALANWQLVEALDPNYPQLYLHLGQAQAALGDSETAVTHLERILNADPANESAYLALGKVHHQSQHWRKAQQVYAQALARLPDSAEIQYATGWLLMEWGKIKQAHHHIRKATQLDPQHGLAWYRLAQLAESERKRQDATRAYKKAAALLSSETIAGKKARQRLSILDPHLSRVMASSWFELTRQLTGPVLICVMAALFDAGLRPWWIPWTGWGALLLGILGAFFWVSGAALPQNPAIRFVAGQGGLTSMDVRMLVATFGLIFWLAALGIILLPIGQTLPEIPS